MDNVYRKNIEQLTVKNRDLPMFMLLTPASFHGLDMPHISTSKIQTI